MGEEGCYYREGDTGNKRKVGTMEQGRSGDCHFWPPHHAFIFTIDCIRFAGSCSIRTRKQARMSPNAGQKKKSKAESRQKYLEWKSNFTGVVAEVATATAPSKFSIYIQKQTDGCEKMCEWRSRSNVALPVKLKSAGRLGPYEHISFSMHKILQNCVFIAQAIPLPFLTPLLVVVLKIRNDRQTLGSVPRPSIYACIASQLQGHLSKWKWVTCREEVPEL